MAMKVVVGDPTSDAGRAEPHRRRHLQSDLARSDLDRTKESRRRSRDPSYLRRTNGRQGNLYFEQLPGPKNPLGQIKFETRTIRRLSARYLDAQYFERVARALSHGCVRPRMPANSPPTC